jgi:predicted metal-dependent phosphotriesterase family hydrolase
MVEPSTVGVGRRVDMLLTLSQTTGLPLACCGLDKAERGGPRPHSHGVEGAPGSRRGGSAGGRGDWQPHDFRVRGVGADRHPRRRRFRSGSIVWIHAQREPDVALHFEAARRGAAIEYDGIGRGWRPQGSDDGFVQLVLDALNAGLTDRVLLSQDLIGYVPALPGGGDPQPYAYLTEVFLPRLRAAGVTRRASVPWRMFGRA